MNQCTADSTPSHHAIWLSRNITLGVPTHTGEGESRHGQGGDRTADVPNRSGRAMLFYGTRVRGRGESAAPRRAGRRRRCAWIPEHGPTTPTASGAAGSGCFDGEGLLARTILPARAHHPA